jgi:cytochrome c oxidase assembly protein subunit 15
MSLSTSAAEPTASLAPASSAPSRLLRGFAWGVLAYNVAVILWGAAVRATGSGAGCGEHWPLCNGTVIQRFPTVASVIEFTHRATSGIALIAILALLVWTIRATAKRHLARAAVIAAFILTLNEALIGALLVLLGKVAHDQSASRAVYLGLHLTNTLLMVAALALTAHFLSRQRGFMRGSVEIRNMGLTLTGLIAVILTGVTGSLAALADTLYPSTSLRAAFAQDFSAHSSWLVRIRWVHPAASLLAGLFVLAIIALGLRSRTNRRLAAALAGLLLLQYALGVADLTLLAPLSLQILHLLGADLLWIALVILAARLSLRPIGCTEGLCG